MPDAVRELTYGEAVREAIAEEMRRDPRVFLIGEHGLAEEMTLAGLTASDERTGGTETLEGTSVARHRSTSTGVPGPPAVSNFGAVSSTPPLTMPGNPTETRSYGGRSVTSSASWSTIWCGVMG